MTPAAKCSFWRCPRPATDTGRPLRKAWVLAAIVGASLLCRSADALTCSAGISPQTARRVFDAALKLPRAPGYKFEGVSTRQSLLELRWSLNGRPCPPIRVSVLDCAHVAEDAGKLEVHAASELGTECPALADAPGAIARMVQTEHAVGGKLPPAPTWMLDALALGIALAALAAALLLRAKEQLKERAARIDLGRVPFLAAAIVLVLLSIAEQLRIPIRREMLGGDIERLYRTAAWSPWEHLAHPGDYHHPGLWFALLHWPFEWAHHSLVVPAVLDRGCLVLAIVLAGALVHEWAGRLPALAAMANVALLPLLAEQSRETSDVTLFVALALATLLGWIRLRRQPTLGRSVLFALMFGLSFHASYAAIPLAEALFVDLLRDRARRRRLGWAFGGGLLIGAPRILHILMLIPLELSLRHQTAQSTVPQWSNVPFGSFLHRTMDVYFSPAFWIVVTVMAFTAAAGRRLWSERAVLLLGIAAYAAFLLLQPLMRVRDYYALMLPVLAIVLTASLAAPQAPGEPAGSAALRRLLALAGSAMMIAVFTCQMLFLWPAWIARESGPDRTRPVIEAARADGARTIAFDSDWQHTTWDFLSDPYGTMRRCLRGATPNCAADGGDFQDAASDRRVVGLAPHILTTEWQSLSIARLQAMQAGGDVHLFLDRGLPNPGLFGYVAANCQRLAHEDMYEMWRCSRR